MHKYYNSNKNPLFQISPSDIKVKLTYTLELIILASILRLHRIYSWELRKMQLYSIIQKKPRRPIIWWRYRHHLYMHEVDWRIWQSSILMWMILKIENTQSDKKYYQLHNIYNRNTANFVLSAGIFWSLNTAFVGHIKRFLSLLEYSKNAKAKKYIILVRHILAFQFKRPIHNELKTRATP